MPRIVSKVNTTLLSRIKDVGDGTIVTFVDANSPLLNFMELREVVYISSQSKAYSIPLNNKGGMDDQVYNLITAYQDGKVTEREFTRTLVLYGTARRREIDRSKQILAAMEAAQKPKPVEDVHIGGYL